jgi:glyoxylase-like metal-dependent hydrolase (beta-lactamase superfamily II)
VTPAKLGLQVFTGSTEGFLVNSTLVYGNKDAVLIDAQFTLADAQRLADVIRGTNKNLTTVYVTHSHPDHYFGFTAIRDAFPRARLVALPATVAEIQKTWKDKVKEWQPVYKAGIPDKPVIPEPLRGTEIDLEGEKLLIVGGVQGDEANDSYVLIPSLQAVVCGDIVYDGVYPWTAETTPESRKTWLDSLSKLSDVGAETVVPGHQKPDRKERPSALNFTKAYLVRFDEALASSRDAGDLRAKMKEEYPDAALDVILKIGADAAFRNVSQ